MFFYPQETQFSPNLTVVFMFIFLANHILVLSSNQIAVNETLNLEAVNTVAFRRDFQSLKNK